MIRAPILASAAALAILLAAGCDSPEAGRQSGEPGADVGNRGMSVEFHAGARPYFGTPCASSLKPCTGPPPQFGPQP